MHLILTKIGFVYLNEKSNRMAINRRQFFENSGRWVSLLVLAILGTFFITKREITHQSSCAENPSCNKCSQFEGCEKTQANSNRHLDVR